MEEETSKLETLSTEPRQGSGSMLAAARKQQQKTIEEIAQELNLSVTQIKTIELDQTEGLPEPTYVRGYIRSYAKLLGLKPEEVLHNYLNPDWQKTSSLNDIPRGIGAAEDSSPSFFSPTKLAVLLILALVVTGLWYYGALEELFGSKNQSSSGSATSIVASANSPTADTQSTESEFQDPEQRIAGNQTTSETGSTTVTNANTADSDAESGQGSAENVDATEPVENVLLMNFTETSWVDIRDADDDRLAYKSYAQGEQLEVREVGVLKVFIGNAAGVKVLLNEQPFDIEAHREGVYAKFVIDPSQ